jgi:hypothetical protein
MAHKTSETFAKRVGRCPCVLYRALLNVSSGVKVDEVRKSVCVCVCVCVCVWLQKGTELKRRTAVVAAMDEDRQRSWREREREREREGTKKGIDSKHTPQAIQQLARA